MADNKLPFDEDEADETGKTIVFTPKGAPNIPVEVANHFVIDTGAPRRLEVLDWIQNIVSVFVVVIILFIFVGRTIGVDGASMERTFKDSDQVVLTNFLYTPKYGDVVIIHVDAYNEVPLVKRVIATAGQTVDIDAVTHEVTVDGVVLDEPYIREPTSRLEDFVGPVTVPAGCIFVMGDNRNASTDSRSSRVGFVDVRNVLGKVQMIIMPGKDDYGNRDWSRIGSVYDTLPK